MKALLSICLFVVTSFVFAGEIPADTVPAAGVVTGVVQEVQNVSNFTYLRLKNSNDELWVAVINTPIKVGATVTIDDAIVMKNFASKGLNKTFPMILFGTLHGVAGKASRDASMSVLGYSGIGTSGLIGMNNPPATKNAMGTGYSSLPDIKTETIKVEHVDKASGADAHTVEEVIKNGVQLKNKPVVVRGKVVKYNDSIMGKNWIHLQDGSGSAKDATDDILVTTKNVAKLGDVVTVKGIVHNDKDFGAGYAYKVLIEEAALQK